MSTASQTIRKLFSRSLSRALSIWGVAIVAAMLVGQAASASPVVLYDSINGSTVGDADPANNGSWLANQFNTDAASYTLQSVVLDFAAAPLGTIAVDIYSDASGTPSTSLGTLTNPGSFGAGSNTFSATGIPTLATSSSFWVVLRGVSSGSVSWNWTSDTPTGFGSSTNTNLSGNSGQTWGGLVSGSPYMMTINATTSAAVPEIDPASFGSALSLVLGSLSLLGRRRRQG
ncbi:MAG: hypothetical protein NT171_03220 [Planctomycetota bacterium]|nr:hypothetical protein [Planctomycetota bacterium]